MGFFPSDNYRRGVANRDPEEEALGWVVRFSSGDATEADRREFDHWQADSENAVSYERAQRLWTGLGPILAQQEASGWPQSTDEDLAEPASPGAVPPCEEGVAPPRQGRFRSYRRAAMAASLAILAGIGAQYVRVWQYDHVSAGTVATDLALADGTRITMGPGTALDTDFAHGVRHVTLARGEAYFDVRHDPAHPFVVSTDVGVVRVLGTAFSVRRDGGGATTVTVTRGRVEVTSGARSVFLTPDHQVSFGTEGLGRIHAVEASLATAWMRGRLIMEDRPLAEVLAELDRYREGRTVLLNGEAGQRRINAVIDLERTDSWLDVLASSQGLKLNRLGPVVILR
ncbi:FecR family protein [Novosphingobium sp. CF614]|uniref:FecR family protein n=1 Tax=Novosphingobium sp. CF614 TaxID=1884364 RepID=UPI0008E24082|nr:FecR domain-containing protein [Novosphingobium sp. CF614]SFF82593.1 FecR family protein [Novosphingobium sp. CF614]